MRHGEAEYSDACVRDPKVMALRDRVTAAVDKAMHEDQVHVTIRMRDGRSYEKFVEHAVGSLSRPMSDADLEAKFRGLAKGILPAAQADHLIGLCWKIDSCARPQKLRGPWPCRGPRSRAAIAG